MTFFNLSHRTFTLHMLTGGNNGTAKTNVTVNVHVCSKKAWRISLKAFLI